MDLRRETFPQYWTTLDTTKDGFAFVVRTSEHEWHGVSYDGKHCPTTLNHWHTQGGPYRKRLTEAEALALLDPKPQPAQPRRTVTVPKWLVIDDQGLTFILEQSEMPSGSSYIDVSKVGETTYEIE